MLTSAAPVTSDLEAIAVSRVIELCSQKVVFFSFKITVALKSNTANSISYPDGDKSPLFRIN